MEALEAFKVPNVPQDPEPFSYLQHDYPCNFDIKLEVHIQRKFRKFFTICEFTWKTIYKTINFHYSLKHKMDRLQPFQEVITNICIGLLHNNWLITL